jgi:hypothetical protein
MLVKMVLIACCTLVARGDNTFVLRGNFTVAQPIVVSTLKGHSFLTGGGEKDKGTVYPSS